MDGVKASQASAVERKAGAADPPYMTTGSAISKPQDKMVPGKAACNKQKLVMMKQTSRDQGAEGDPHISANELAASNPQSADARGSCM